MPKKKKTLPESGQVTVAYPDPRVFGDSALGQKRQAEDSIIPERSTVMGEKNRMYIHYDTLYPDTGGIYRCYHGCKYAEKSFAWPAGIHAANTAKRLLVGHIKLVAKDPFMLFRLATSKQFRNRFIQTYVEAADMTLRPIYFMGEYPRYYSNMAKQIKAFLDTFLPAIGITQENAFGFSRALMTCMEQDNAYRVRVQDLAGVTTQARIIKNLPKEMDLIAKAFAQRDPSARTSESGQGDKLASFSRIMKLAWMWPSYRRAIKKGLRAMQWEYFVLDEGDRYFNLCRFDYDIEGRSFDDRVYEFYKVIHEGKQETYPPMFEYWMENGQPKTRIIVPRDK